jgi:2-polyprenyl-3-methyl-5-hydroxy-6-metoxy-1,4-benzoquinol methylase
MAAKFNYLPGHSDQEIERLQLQARCLEGLTRRLINECGMRPGLRVLDIGTGVGDVAMLVAETVGPSGSVVGVDAGERAVEAARHRVREAGLRQVEFAVGTDQDLEKFGQFDAAIGRFVLIHQPDPAAMVRRTAAAVRSGGIVAFLEPAIHVDGSSLPEIELARAVEQSWKKFLRVALPSHDVAGRIIYSFLDAGLPEPRVLWESVVPGSDTMWLRLLVKQYETSLPFMERLGLVDPRVGDPATLYDRILAAGRAARTQGATSPFASAWAVRP